MEKCGCRVNVESETPNPLRPTIQIHKMSFTYCFKHAAVDQLLEAAKEAHHHTNCENCAKKLHQAIAAAEKKEAP